MTNAYGLYKCVPPPPPKILKDYRACICGEERIVKGWSNEGHLITDKETFEFKPLECKKEPGQFFQPPADLKAFTQSRLLEVVRLAAYKNGWLVNGHPLAKLLEGQIRTGLRLLPITTSNTLRIHKQEICAVAFFCTLGSYGLRVNIEVEQVLNFWKHRLKGDKPTIQDLHSQALLYLRSPVWLTCFETLGQPTVSNADVRSDVTEALIWIVQQKIQDELDDRLKAAPSASRVFILYCRDRMTLKEIQRKLRCSYRTVKLRKSKLEILVAKNYPNLTLESFFVDRSMFNQAERMAQDFRAKGISPSALAGRTDEEENDQG